MQVVLLERVERLGQIGDVVNVRPGFARNFLLPRKKALRATKANLEQFEDNRAQLEAANLERRGEAESVAAKVEGLTVILIRQAGESGQLYGSVTGRDVASAATEAGCTIERGQVQLEKPIKMLGMHPIRVVLHPEVSISITANVARTEAEAEQQQRKGSAVLRAGDEEDETDLAADEVFEEGAAPEELEVGLADAAHATADEIAEDADTSESSKGEDRARAPDATEADGTKADAAVAEAAEAGATEDEPQT